MKRLLLILALCSPAFAQVPTVFGALTAGIFTSAGPSGTVTLVNGGSPVGADTLYVVTAYSHAGAPAFTTPAGWTLLCNVNSASTVDDLYIFYKGFANGTTPPANVVVSLTSGNGNLGFTSVGYQSVNLAVPFDLNGSGNCTGGVVNGATSVTTNVGATSVVGSSFTTLNANEQAVWVYAVNGDIGAPAITITQGTTESSVSRSTSGATLYTSFVDKAFAATGATGTNTLTWTNSVAPQFAVTFAVEGAAGASAAAGVLLPKTVLLPKSVIF